ncbi:MAG: hypothetical protein ACFFE2_09765 [Candidatus Thorarchaeota archaeon]
MKKSATLALVALFTTMIIIPQTTAFTSQGFFYRPENGNRFHFTLDLTDEGDVLPTEVIYIEIVDANIPIPDPVTYLGDLSYLDVVINFENDTSIGLMALTFLFILYLAYPVGNWDLLTTLAATDLEGLLFVEARDITVQYDDNLWGFSYKTNNSADTETTVSVDYSKFDGVLYSYNIENKNTTTDETISLWEFNRFAYHTLRWGFNDGDRFDFVVNLTGDDLGFTDLEEEMYIEVDEDGLPILPYLMVDFDDILYIGANLYWANGTESYDPFFSHSWRLAVPIGNWSLLDDLVEGMDTAVNATPDGTNPWFWGYSRDSISGDIRHQIHTDYLKTDGFLAHHTAVFTNITTSEVIGTINITRQGLDAYTSTTTPTMPTTNGGLIDIILDNLLYIGIGVGVVILLGVVNFARKKS